MVSNLWLYPVARKKADCCSIVLLRSGVSVASDVCLLDSIGLAPMTRFAIYSMNLFHREFGDPTKPPLLVLHGLLGSSRNWQGGGSDLGEYFHVCCLDLRNHGKSGHAFPHSYDAMKDDVIEWMESHEIRRCHLLGHSMGGKLAMKIACDNSERVRRLVVVDIVPKRYPGSHDSEYDAMNAIDLEKLISRKEADELLMKNVPDWGKRQFLLTNLSRRREGPGFYWIANIKALEANRREIEGSPLILEDRFEGETLFVMGGKSKYSEPMDYPGLSRYFPNCVVEVMEESGHNPHFEFREEFVSRVAKFLDEDETCA